MPYFLSICVKWMPVSSDWNARCIMWHRLRLSHLNYTCKQTCLFHSVLRFLPPGSWSKHKWNCEAAFGVMWVCVLCAIGRFLPVYFDSSFLPHHVLWLKLRQIQFTSHGVCNIRARNFNSVPHQDYEKNPNKKFLSLEDCVLPVTNWMSCFLFFCFLSLNWPSIWSALTVPFLSDSFEGLIKDSRCLGSFFFKMCTMRGKAIKRLLFLLLLPVSLLPWNV